MALFLQLPPEMGGLRFGPFDGIVQLGSDARRCQVVLDSSQGVYPIHATLAAAGGGQFHFAPADLNAKCFVVQQGSPQVWPVQGAVEVKLGDAIVVGTPGGPRFLLMDATGHQPARPAGGLGMIGSFQQAIGMKPTRRVNQQSMQQGIADEMQRRAQASLMRNSTFRELSYLQRRLKTGQLFNPVTIVGTLITIGSMLLAGGVSCSGALFALWQKYTF